MNKFRIIDLLRSTNVVSSYNSYKGLYSGGSTTTEELRELQRTRLANFLLSIKDNDFYKSYLGQVSSVDINENPYEIHGLLPIVDKTIINESFSSIACSSNKINSERNYTGGSTGTPFKYLIDKKSISATRGFNYFLWSKMLGYNFGDNVLVVTGTSLGANSGFIHNVYNYLQSKQFVSGDVINDSNTKMFVKLINSSKKGVFLYGYPSSIVAYTNVLSKNDINTQNIKGIITTSEMLYNEDKQTLEDFFSTRVLNVYGANDGGIIAGSVNNHEFLYNGTDCFVEIMNLDGANELLLTNLNSQAFPFVRYRVGDCAEALLSSDEYPFAILNLTGRTRDLLYGINRERVHGSIINKLVKHFDKVEQYQIHQQVDYSCDIYLKSESEEYINSISNSLCVSLRSVLGSGLPIRIHFKKELPRLSNGKFKVIVSDVI